jgi:hypothetical protein
MQMPTPSETAINIGGTVDSTIASAAEKGVTRANANPACIHSIANAKTIAGTIPSNLPLLKWKTNPAINPAKIVAIAQGTQVTPPRKKR